jgi:hypothetical protein
MGELKTTTLEKISDSIAASSFYDIIGIGLADISSHTDISREDENICPFGVLDVQISKFKM